ncbi:MAG: hypothetical protein SV686_06190 [Thermodesulfobacteriota bacterium]|nr:hypothetical protein [Thermodesulfobacteriota bacterium]
MLVTHQLRYYILEEVRNEVDTQTDVRARDGVKRDVSMVLLSGAYLYLVSEEGAGKTRSAKSLTKMLPSIPAIDTKVRVLLHPVLEEKKSILEECNSNYPVDLIVIATGNPEDFSFVD